MISIEIAADSSTHLMPYPRDFASTQCAGIVRVRPRRPLHCRVWLCVTVLGLTVLFCNEVGAVSTLSNSEPKPATFAGTMPDWEKILPAAASIMEKPVAGTDPLVLFIDPLGRQLGFSDAATTLAAKKLPPALAAELQVAELAETARRLVRSLAAWNVAKAARHLSSATDEAEMDLLARQIAQLAGWLTEETGVSTARSITAALPALRLQSTEVGAPDEAAYRKYAALLDARYPLTPSSSDSWLAILERDGVQGWQQRLRVGVEQDMGEVQNIEVLAEQYLESRLRPLLRLRLAQQSSDLETRAIQEAYRDWLSIYGWKDSVRLRRGLARLCGSWQWTVHNHQNHGEQKLMVSFPAAGNGQDHAGPAEIVVLGDLVYLRWEAGGRVQEDSLLFSKEGQRLEGSFVNNMGGWGSVTGKRTAGCSKK